MGRRPGLSLAPLAVIVAAGAGLSVEPSVDLPPGVKVVWDLARAHREATATRERISINGLWRFQPAAAGAGEVPADNWGYFKVPGCWPGITDHMQKDCQRVFPHPLWKGTRLGGLTAAWYQRQIEVPAGWAGRRIALYADYVNSHAAVYLDGKKAGEIRFPGGEVDLTQSCRPGEKQFLSLLVVSMPLKAVLASFADTAAPREKQGSVPRRGLCGDLYLAGEPAGPTIVEVRVETSVAGGMIALDTECRGLARDRQYVLGARVTDRGRITRELRSPPFTGADLKEGRLTFSDKWVPERLWDIHTPRNLYSLSMSLLDSGGKVLDEAYPSSFGFRELAIRGRDFFLNNRRVYLSALPLDNAEVGAAWASYEGARESLLRLKEIGINFVYTHNYGCEPGTHLSFAEALRAADDVGMLVSLSQPHFGQYDWKAVDADRNNGYERHARFYTRVAGNHPSVVFYSMSHNATGYSEDMNPDMIDGASDQRDSWARNNAKLALRAEAIVKRLDPGRIVYHHSSGNLGSMHTSNFYTNFAPIQELDDWFEHWATQGKKPVFTCEYMVPCTWDWTMYRGWYKERREFGSAVVPWDYCLAEWNAQFLGDRAYRIGEPEKANIRWEAKQYRAGNLWHRWDYPHPVGSKRFEEVHKIIGDYLTSNWRAFRTWGVSATSPWEHHFFWSLREGVDRSRRELHVDWDDLQKPGFSPDYLDERLERSDLAFERSDWIPTADGRAILRNNMPLLAYLAGKPASFTSKDHLFTPGESFEKQLIVINNSRETVDCECRWSLGLPQAQAGSKRAAVPTGEQERIPLRFTLPAGLAPGSYVLAATVPFSTGEVQEDSFTIQVLPAPEPPRAAARIALFDPRGETGKLLEGMRLAYQPVDAGAGLGGYEVLVVGKGALTLEGAAPDLSGVRDGLRVLIFEQTAEVLERRFGFRVAEYGLRHVFKRVPDHPILAGLEREELRDWRGAATLLSPRLEYALSPRLAHVPAVRWCDLEVSHVWRCGNRGSVASVLIEKPARGDFLPLLEGGYNLEYSPLLEYREGKGVVIFCQMDVTGRTEPDPAAGRLVHNLLESISKTSPPPRLQSHRVLWMGGGGAGKAHLQAAGLTVTDSTGGALAPDQVLVVGSGPVKELAANAPAVAEFLRAGGRLLALELDEAEANALLPFKVSMKRKEHIACSFEPAGAGSWLAGVGPADVHNRDPREIPLVSGGATAIGDGVLAEAVRGQVVFCQLVPYEVSKARGALPSYSVNQDDAAEGKRSAFLTAGAVSGRGARLGQKVAGVRAGKTYTFAVFARAVDRPVPARLEIWRPDRPQDRSIKAKDTLIPEEEWTELHTTFKVEEASSEGWFAGVTSGEEGARLRLDGFRLHEGEHVPGKLPAGAENLFQNPGFEAGMQPWSFEHHEQYNVRRTYRRASYLLTRLLANLGAAGETPLLERFQRPVGPAEKRWLDGFYLDQPEEWDDPYRFFRW